MNLLALKIALRFLAGARRDRPLSLFAAVAVGAIALSVALFLMVDAVMNGFSGALADTLIGFNAPLSWELPPGAPDQKERLDVFIARHPEFGLRASSTREFYGLFREAAAMPMGIKARVVDQGFFDAKQGDLTIRWREGFDANSFQNSSEAILVGKEILKAFPYVLDVEERAELIHPFADIGPSGELEPQSRNFIVAGTIATGDYEIDNFYVFLPAGALSGFANANLMATRYLVYPRSVALADRVARAWHSENPDAPGQFKTWLEDNAALFKAMALERKAFGVLFALLVAVACLNLASIVRIFAIGKLRETAVLKSLGADSGLVRSVYVSIGALLGACGGLIGVVSGTGIVWLFKAGRFHLPEAYGFGVLPVAINPATVAVLAVLAPVVAAVVAWFPAQRAARAVVIDVLRLS